MAERRARSTRSRTCRISPARTPGERSRESSECLEVGESDSTFNVRYQIDYDALATRYTQHLRLSRRAAATATALRRDASPSAGASRARAASSSYSSTKVERKMSPRAPQNTRKGRLFFAKKSSTSPIEFPSKEGGQGGARAQQEKL